MAAPDPLDVSTQRPGSTISNKAADKVLYPEARQENEAALNEDLRPHMIRRPVEADFADVLSPEGDSGRIEGSDVSDSVIASNASVGGTG